MFAFLLNSDSTYFRKVSTSELTRHIELGYFWVKGLVDRGLISIMYCPTDMVIADFFTKPLQGSLFEKMKGKIMGTYPYTVYNKTWTKIRSRRYREFFLSQNIIWFSVLSVSVIFYNFYFIFISGISFFVCYDPPYCHIIDYNVGVCWI